MTTDHGPTIDAWVARLRGTEGTTTGGRLCDQPAMVKAAVLQLCPAEYSAQVRAEREREAREAVRAALHRSNDHPGGAA